jgi:hypothetical protein
MTNFVNFLRVLEQKLEIIAALGVARLAKYISTS